MNYLSPEQQLLADYEQFISARRHRISILERAHICQHYDKPINERRQACSECAMWSEPLDPKQEWEVQA